MMKLITRWLCVGCALALVAGDDPAKSTRVLKVDSALVTIIEQVEVAAQETGVLATVNVKEGDHVQAGDVLAQIDDEEAKLTARRAELEAEIAGENARNDAAIRSAQKGSALAVSELTRARDAVEKYAKSVSHSEVERLTLVAEKAAIDVEQSQHEKRVAGITQKLKDNEFQLAQKLVDKRRIVAPMPGIVVQVHHKAGEWVQPGEKVLRVLRINALRVEALISRSDVEAVGPLAGKPVKLTVKINGENAEFKGLIVFVHPEVSAINEHVKVWAEVENRGDLLQPGMKGSLTVDLTMPAVQARRR